MRTSPSILACAFGFMAAVLGTDALAQPGKPQVTATYAISPTTLAVVIQEKTVPRNAMTSYTAQPGDEIKPKKGKEKLPVWKDGKLVKEPKSFELYRNSEKVGVVSSDRSRVLIEYTPQGNTLDLQKLSQTGTYSISSQDDSTFGTVTPSKITYKRKPNQYRSKGFRVVTYLHLPKRLTEGKIYTLNLKGITSESSVTYKHDTKNVVSEIIHVSHIGFRPDDPRKEARLSVWTGTGGAFDLVKEGPLACALVNQDTGAIAWEGNAKLILPHNKPDQTREKRNFAKTDVYGIDFSQVKAPGTYRVWVKGIGSSYSFPIQENAWAEAFKISMQGLLSHRSGIALPKELMGYERPRTMHPADGVKILPISRTMMHGESGAIKQSFNEMLKEGTIPEPNDKAWGGYMDAGDWDRRSQHMKVTRYLLEVYESNPTFWKSMKLVLPAEEVNNNLPDILDECWWNLSFYHRIQQADGGVCGGVESTSHPRAAEASWHESLGLGLFAPDPQSSLRFAATAACYARLTAEFNPARAKELEKAALKAYAWANSPAAQKVIDSVIKEGGNKAKKKMGETGVLRTLAAVHLLWLTEDKATFAPVIAEGFNKQRADKLEEANFAYARIPDSIADANLKAKAKQGILNAAKANMDFQKGVAWGIAGPTIYMPHMGYVGYLSVPGMTSRALLRAYLLTNDEKYLGSAVLACGFSAGANPDNMAYTTGLGPNPVQWPLHIDSYVTGQMPPKGITVYGPGDPQSNHPFEKWVHQWYVNKSQSAPVGKEWPFAEAYWDIYTVPANNEYTVQQTISPTTYTWGILASRGK